MRKVRSGDGFVTVSLGDIEVTALYDGHAVMPRERMRLPGNRVVVEADVPGVGDPLVLSVNAFMVRRGADHLLIDTGSGDAWRDTTGRLYASLAAAGISRGSIGAVALTHTHVDHLSGLVMPDGAVAFPAAEVIHVPEAEMALFGAEARMAPVLGLARACKAGDAVAAGVIAVAAAGHEVGHTAYLVQGLEGAMLIWGDIVHAPGVQFARPEVSWSFDTDQDQARATRAAIFARVAGEGMAVAGAHLAFPGFGWVRAAGAGFAFEALAG